ncbi:MAG: hypothetical protein ACYC06_03065 [Ilumatobacteraceae bacterium]
MNTLNPKVALFFRCGRTLPFVQRYVAGTVFIALGLVAGSTTRN